MSDSLSQGTYRVKKDYHGAGAGERCRLLVTVQVDDRTWGVIVWERAWELGIELDEPELFQMSGLEEVAHE